MWERTHVTPYLAALMLSSLPLVFANLMMEKNSALSFHFKFLSFLVKLNIFMEAHACSKLPSDIFILPQPYSITSKNSYLSQSLFPPSEQKEKSLLGLSRRIWMQVFTPVLTKMKDYTPGSLTRWTRPHLFGSHFNKLSLTPKGTASLLRGSIRKIRPS